METSNFADGRLPELQFTTHESVGPEPEVVGLSCLGCKQPIEKTYFALGDQVLCSSCRDMLSAPPKGSGLLRFAKAACFGTLAGLLGALIWFAIRKIANLEIGLVAILVGFLVGKAVHRASAGRGGIMYQILAVLITYGCIAANYMPDIFEAMMAEVSQRADERATDKEPNDTVPTDTVANKTIASDAVPSDTNPPEVAPKESNTDAAVGETEKLELEKRNDISPVVAIILVALITFVLALATPVVIGMESPIGLLIVGFALWEAWKFSAHRPLPITGPYQVGSQGLAAEQSL